MSTHRAERLRRPHPALLRQAEERAGSVQNRIADTITAHVGSMGFVYAHIAMFGAWKDPSLRRS